LYNDCNEVARKLEQTLEMEIGRLEIEHGPEWVIYDPVTFHWVCMWEMGLFLIVTIMALTRTLTGQV
jgi:hypothetical protein